MIDTEEWQPSEPLRKLTNLELGMRGAAEPMHSVAQSMAEAPLFPGQARSEDARMRDSGDPCVSRVEVVRSRGRSSAPRTA